MSAPQSSSSLAISPPPSSAFPHLTAMASVERLLEVMRLLRERCPWVGQQTPVGLTRYAIEEVYEVEEAVRRGAVEEVRDELGDLLMQVVFQSQMYSEGRYGEADSSGAVPSFCFADVVDSITAKLVRRNPQLFNPLPPASSGCADEEATAEMASVVWQRVKQEEAALKAAREERAGTGKKGAPSLLDVVKHGPALNQAEAVLRVLEGAGVGSACSDDNCTTSVSRRAQRRRAKSAISQLEADLAALKASLGGDDEDSSEGEDIVDYGSSDAALPSASAALFGDAMLRLVAVGRALPPLPSTSIGLPSTSTAEKGVEGALLGAVGRLKERFVRLEALANGVGLADLTAEERQRLWEEAGNVTPPVK